MISKTLKENNYSIKFVSPFFNKSNTLNKEETKTYNDSSLIEESYNQVNNTNSRSYYINKEINLGIIKKVSKLEKRWDGHNAKTFSKRKINLFIKLINELEQQPKIGPTPSGEMIFEFKHGNKELAMKFDLKMLEVFESINEDYDNGITSIFSNDVENNILKKVKEFYEE